MKPTAQTSLRIAEPAGAASVSRVRKQFNGLIKRIASMRAQLAAWKETMPVILRQADQEYAPLEREFSGHQKAMVLLLDQMSRHKSLGKRDRVKLGNVICVLAFELLAREDDDDIKAIYNHHSGGDFDAAVDADNDDAAAAKGALEDLLGVQLDDDVDWRSPEATFEALARRAEQEQATAAKAPRHQSASAIAREQRAAAEADRLKQSVRDIFRKLVSELHPDREPEGRERARKTALMQRVNAAYAADDLLALLELQLEIEQIDQAVIDKLGDEQIRQYNKILARQLSQLESETESFMDAAEMATGIVVRGRVTPQVMLRSLRAEIDEMRAANAGIVGQLEVYSNVNELKAWLKTCRVIPRPHDDDVFWY